MKKWIALALLAALISCSDETTPTGTAIGDDHGNYTGNSVVIEDSEAIDSSETTIIVTENSSPASEEMVKDETVTEVEAFYSENSGVTTDGASAITTEGEVKIYKVASEDSENTVDVTYIITEDGKTLIPVNPGKLTGTSGPFNYVINGTVSGLESIELKGTYITIVEVETVDPIDSTLIMDGGISTSFQAFLLDDTLYSYPREFGKKSPNTKYYPNDGLQNGLYDVHAQEYHQLIGVYDVDSLKVNSDVKSKEYFGYMDGEFFVTQDENRNDMKIYLISNTSQLQGDGFIFGKVLGVAATIFFTDARFESMHIED